MNIISKQAEAYKQGFIAGASEAAKDLKQVRKLELELIEVRKERNKYREKAIQYNCSSRQGFEGCNTTCHHKDGTYCKACIEEVDA